MVKDKARGCLIGGASGDALGYSVEFLRVKDIVARYGNRGIREYDLDPRGLALISDDTQMTLFTAEGLLNAKDGDYLASIWESYKDWYLTQTKAFPVEAGESELLKEPSLFSPRAPGMTCLSVIRSNIPGSIDNPINDSKGCGGIMRVAPIGLYFSGDHKRALKLGAESAALTHGHSLGYIPAASLSLLISILTENEEISLIDAVFEMRGEIFNTFKEDSNIDYFISLLDEAIELSNEEGRAIEHIKVLGEGWVAEETLAIALYSALRYSNNFERAIISSVNHSGDSDSTGSVCGNIMGAYLGLSQIPEKLLTNLELKDLIIGMADKITKTL